MHQTSLILNIVNTFKRPIISDLDADSSTEAVHCEDNRGMQAERVTDNASSAWLDSLAEDEYVEPLLNDFNLTNNYKETSKFSTSFVSYVYFQIK